MSKKVFIIFLIIFLIFSAKSWFYLDPDFGWHLKTGDLILQGQFPKTDPFSYTMPSFPYVDHAWIVSIFFSFLYPFIGRLGLSFIISFIAILALWISFPNKIKYLFPIIISTSILVYFVGLRSQVFTWLMLAILLRIILNIKLWEKFKYLFPFFFLFWANLHGGFVSGILVMTFILILRIIRVKKFLTVDVGILALSIFATLINPYNLGLWREILLDIFSGSLRYSISEWLPTIYIANIPMIVFFPTFSYLIWYARKSFNLEKLSLFAIFLIQSVLTTRHIPLFILVSLPMVEEAIDYISKKTSHIKYARKRLKKAHNFIIIVSIFVLCLQLYILINNNNFSFRSDKFYPEKAVVYLKSNLPKGEIFSTYNWGGYLIWKLPEKKVFIDGRMPVWKRDVFPKNETGSAFSDFRQILFGEKDYIPTFLKFNIDTLLLATEKEKKGIELFDKKPTFNFNNKLEEDGWEKVYSDEVSIIFQKSTN